MCTSRRSTAGPWPGRCASECWRAKYLIRSSLWPACSPWPERVTDPGHETPPRLRSGRVDLPAHDPRVLADLADPAEPMVLEQLDGRSEQEPAVCLAAGCHLGDCFDETATSGRDLLECAAKRRPGDALPTMLRVDPEAGDPPVR